MEESTDEEALAEGLRALARIIAREFLDEVESKRKSEPSPELNVERVIVEQKETAVPDGELVEAKTVASRLGIPLASVWRLTRSGEIPHYKLGSTYRYDLPEVMSAIKSE